MTRAAIVVGALLLAGCTSEAPGLGVIGGADGACDPEAVDAGRCGGGERWATRFGDTAHDAATALARFDDGDLVVAGDFTGALPMGAAPTPVANQAVYLARLDPEARTVRWRRTLEGWGRVARVATTPQGDLIAIGIFNGAMAFAPRSALHAQGTQAFILKLDGATGDTVWVTPLEGDGTVRLQGLAIDEAGRPIVSGTTNGALDLDIALPAPAQEDAFVLKLDDQGSILWSRPLGGPLLERVLAVTTTPDGAIAVTGRITGPATFGNHTLSHDEAEDVFAAELSADGTVRWARSYPGSGSDGGLAIAMSPEGHIVVAGAFTQRIDFDGHVLTSGGCEDVFVLTLDRDGHHVASHSFGDASPQILDAVGVDAAGDVVVAGGFWESTDFGVGVAMADTAGDAFILKIAADGTPLWHVTAGDAGAQRVTDMLLTPDGHAIAIGHFEGSVDFGGGAMSSAGQRDAFVVELGR